MNRKTFLQSLSVHLIAAAALLALSLTGRKSDPNQNTVDIEVIDHPTAAMNPMASTPVQPKPQAAPQKKAVSGMNRNALIDSQSDVSVKKGNTLAVAPDQKKLGQDDPDSIPTPVDEYLVSKMPRLVRDLSVPYPEAAKKAAISGPVRMELLIDQKGQVRESKVISGPGYGLNEAAQKASFQFLFNPAEVDGKTVAVRIIYVYRFVLEN